MSSNWTLAAACRGLNTEVWFSDNAEEQLAAKSVCARCPVAWDCLNDAIATDDTTAYGIRAGLTGRQRSEARRDRLRQRMTAA